VRAILSLQDRFARQAKRWHNLSSHKAVALVPCIWNPPYLPCNGLPFQLLLAIGHGGLAAAAYCLQAAIDAKGSSAGFTKIKQVQGQLVRLFLICEIF
jgi:hypothetical protein